MYFDGLMNILEILKAKKYDHGEVKVVARNHKGNAQHTVSLSVNEPFEFKSQLHPSEGWCMNTCKVEGWSDLDVC